MTAPLPSLRTAAQAVVDALGGVGCLPIKLDDAIHALRAVLAQPVEVSGWMTHHDEPMLFPTREEAASYCDYDEEPIPLEAAPDAQSVDALQADPARAYALNLATTLWERHFKAQAPDWEPLDDTLGLLTQIDNMVAGITVATPPQPAQPEADAGQEVELPALSDDDLRRIATEVGMVSSHDGVYMRSIGTHGGMNAEDGFAFARAAIAADRASRAAPAPVAQAVVGAVKEPSDEQVLAALTEYDLSMQSDPRNTERGRDNGKLIAAMRKDAMREALRAVFAAPPAPAQVVSEASPDVAKTVEEAKELLDETYRFAATSPRSQENINAVCDLLDKIEAATIREDSSEAAQSIQRALKQWDGEAGVWIERRAALAAIDALGAAATQARAAASEPLSVSEREVRP